MNAENEAIILRAHKRIDKKYYGTPSYLSRKHVVNTMSSVLKNIDDISFADLALDNFYICREVGFRYLSEKYRGALEFAKMQPERLADQLYKMLRDMGKEIRSREGGIEEFFLFMSLFEENASVSEKYHNIYLAYMDLMLEQTEFLKPNLYDINHMVAGVTTDGEVLLTKDPFPDIDLPVYELVRLSATGVEGNIVFSKILKKHGIDSEEEYQFYNSAANLYSNNISLLVPYINEYTFDMIPKPAYAPTSEIPIITAKSIDFRERLQNRHKTLPANGAVITVENSIYLKKATLKEMFHNNMIHLLCRFDTTAGETTVRYNTKTGGFFSSFAHLQGYCADLHQSLKMLSLWFYTAYVCPDEDIKPTAESYHDFTNDKNAVLTFTSMGGKPRTTLNHTLNRHIDYDRYTEKSVSIVGYIRKLPDGQRASEEKRRLAELLGLALAENETYVEPHNRRYWKLKIIE